MEEPRALRKVYLVTLPRPQASHSACGRGLVAAGSLSHRQILNAFFSALAATQAARDTPLEFLKGSVFKGQHGSGDFHYHIAVLATTNFRFATLKKQLLQQAGLASHWSCSHARSIGWYSRGLRSQCTC